MSAGLFEDLTPTDFEWFCYGLLQRQGFTNLVWRKGAIGASSPADGGRDIDGLYRQRDPDGWERDEVWFAECKHHKKSLSFSKMSGLLTAAEAHGADVALLMTSSYLTNAARADLDAWIKNTKPRCRVRVWDRAALETLHAKEPGQMRDDAATSYLEVLDKLAHPEQMVRAGALTELELMGQRAPARGQQVVDSICAYLRRPAQLGDTEGRLTAQSILCRHLAWREWQAGPDRPDDLWDEISVDLSGAELADLDFRGVLLQDANFTGARFTGETFFAGAAIHGSACFDEITAEDHFDAADATFDCPVSVERAVFRQGAYFHRSRFSYEANFSRARFRKYASFKRTAFHDTAIFRHTTFGADASFENATIKFDADFSAISVGDVISFEGASFNDAAAFRGSRGKFDFYRARFRNPVLIDPLPRAGG